jgi:hypothetical protein
VAGVGFGVAFLGSFRILSESTRGSWDARIHVVQHRSSDLCRVRAINIAAAASADHHPKPIPRPTGSVGSEPRKAWGYHPPSAAATAAAGVVLAQRGPSGLIVIDRLRLGALDARKIRCNEREPLPKATTTERLLKARQMRGFFLL